MEAIDVHRNIDQGDPRFRYLLLMFHDSPDLTLIREEKTLLEFSLPSEIIWMIEYEFLEKLELEE